MAQDEAAASDIAVAERPDETPAAVETAPILVGPIQPDEKNNKKNKKPKDEEDLDYEVNFETPFGKIEFEFEPSASKERKDREKRAKAEAAAAKAAAKLAKKTQKQQLTAATIAAQPIVIHKSGSKLVPILLIFLLVAGAIALAIWLFARPGEEEQDVVPPEFRNADDVLAEPAPPPQGFAAKAQHRIRTAIHAGRQASRDAQSEQERKFQDLTGKK